jgi:hypothetical protein
VSSFRHIIIFVALLPLCGCNTTSVGSSKPKRLYIASDFLTPKDSVFFSGFSKKEDIKVLILSMSADSIVSHYKQFGYNSKFDLVLMKSTYSLNLLSKAKVLHTIPEENKPKEIGFASLDSDWIILGVDPYVISGLESKRDFQYNELTFGKKWKRVLTQEEMASFQVSVLFQFGRKNLSKSVKWLEKIENQSTNQNDTIEVAPYFLSRLSLVRKQGKEYVYPNQSRKFGAFYDGIGMGVVRHGSKYTTSLSLIEYYSNIVHNQRLCNKLNILPIQNPKGMSSFLYQNEYPLLFRCTPYKATPLFRDLKRIRTRI